MPSLKRLGFFHFGSNKKCDPVGSLEEEIARSLGLPLEDTLIVLPEAFNARGGLYNSNPDLGPEDCSRLQAISNNRGIAFVVGLIEGIKGSNSAYLIDGTKQPLLLSRKQCAGWDCLYTPSALDETTADLCRGLGVTALVCDDAGRAGHSAADRAQVLSRLKPLNATHNVLCIPAFMTITDSVGIARLWADSITVVVANGCSSHPSVILHRGSAVTSRRYRDENEITLCEF